MTYANTIKPQSPQYKPVPMKQIAYLHGEPRIIWEEEEVVQMIINEDLQFAVIGKFSYGWPDIQAIKWDPMFDPEEETSIVDMATLNNTRPTCARVKMEVDLMGEFPTRINNVVIHLELYPKEEEEVVVVAHGTEKGKELFGGVKGTENTHGTAEEIKISKEESNK
ncbi:hypothetical protein R3W88_034060 [Solanum pinnatisectum]|uniref:Uncharacterized protein n=1 Tax=Solanum pinnatisectum TaxID=50273 RepID=A0AAV9K0U8_9SOLN|nr:hypothetical protein R3W88_034060 [Solanum pinnatisectum]